MCFVHLNVKSCFTFMNSILKLNEAIVKTSKNNQSHLAICDVNTMHTFYDFQNGCNDDKHVLKGNKPIEHIFGVNFLVKSRYMQDEFYLLNLIAKDEVGYRNLIELSTKAKTNKEQFAWIEYSDIERYHDGLFCLTGGSSGEIFALVVQNKENEALELLNYLHKLFKSSLYLEVMNHDIKDEVKFLESGFIEKAMEMDIYPVATNDVHYLNKKDAQYRALAVDMNSELSNLKANETDWIHRYAARYVDYNDEFYLKTEKQMEDAFKKYLPKYPQILSITQDIANQCHALVPVTKEIPVFPKPDGYTDASYLEKLMWEGFEKRFPDDSFFAEGYTRKDYEDRLKYEYDVICQMGFPGYMLIVQDYINFAKDDKVYEHPEIYFPTNIFKDYSQISERILKKDFKIMVGPGRGSGAGSLLAYVTGITSLDPIEKGLLFERFLNPERVSMPDIDTDFPNQYRYLIVDYVQNKYGFDHVSQIVTYNMLGVKSIIKNVGKALGIPYAVTDELSKNVPQSIRVKTYLDDGEEEEKEKKVETLEELKTIDYYKNKIKSDEDVKKLFQIGSLFDGLPSSTGRHACGVIIGATPLKNLCPLMEVDGVLVTQFEKKAIEAIGGLKMDFLGLITLDIEMETLRLIQDVHGVDVELESIPTDDAKTFELFQKGQTAKVFQLESQGMRNLLKRMRPTEFGHINSILALYR